MKKVLLSTGAAAAGEGSATFVKMVFLSTGARIVGMLEPAKRA